MNPFTEQVIAEVPDGTPEDAVAAVLAARTAFNEWAATPLAKRTQLVHDLAEALRARRAELIELTIDELGAPRRDASASQVDLPIDVLDWLAEAADEVEFKSTDGNVTVLREPFGVVSCITPWNYPLHQLVVKVGAALVMGCTVVLKPSEVTPLSAIVFAEEVNRVGFPAGVFNLVNGRGPVVGEVLASHPEVDFVSFTGSTAAGTRVAELAARTVKKVSLELGGKSASVILPDADFDFAVKQTVARCFENSGQACSALTRMLVPRSELARAEDIAAVAASEYLLGDPRDPQTVLGPVVSDAQRARVRNHIDRAIDDGARLVIGGSEQPTDQSHGYFVKPTVLSRVTPDMPIARDEVFGPVLAILGYDDVDEAVRTANATDYGLSSAVWGTNANLVDEVARQMRAGQVIVNGGAWNFRAPFGGYKQSGLGRESGVFGLEEFLEIKALRA
ncbi:betaine-aldehyde dehydrogenase [Aeromicrobium tamlense]|uniref:aldehyde dehydrogenase (NAD(+)) n=1 Tax=Aeromicrobium tamlense TaxID=375541 RepID=A0ABX2SGX4_9ACTN|nr:betaine-aldehyde dehydrogenase [Aeromicrobium tamlense]